MFLDEWSSILQEWRHPFSKELRKPQDGDLRSFKEKDRKELNLLYRKIISSPVLTLHNRTRQLTLGTDAYNGQVDCALLQNQEYCKDRTIAYRTNKLNEPEKKRNTTHLECLAVVRAVLLLRP